jgi:hypothetical protein
MDYTESLRADVKIYMVLADGTKKAMQLDDVAVQHLAVERPAAYLGLAGPNNSVTVAGPDVTLRISVVPNDPLQWTDVE